MRKKSRQLTDAEDGTGENQEPSCAVDLEGPERSDVQGVTSGAEGEGQTRSKKVVHATSEETHDGEAAIENAIGRVTELGILRTTSLGGQSTDSRVIHSVRPSPETYPAPKLLIALNIPTEQKVAKPRITTCVHGELSVVRW